MHEDPDEDWIITTLSGIGPPLAGLRHGIGDDAALFADGRVVTVDTMTEGVHWDDRLSAADVGWKLVAVNVSDVAAMGARAEWALLALGLPSPLDRAWVAGFASGVRAACATWGVALIGGDTTRAPMRTASLTVGGRTDHAVLRSGGRPGDEVWVTGRLGLSAEAFLAPSPRTDALAWLRRPVPPVDFAVALASEGLATAMMDLSDGLQRDLGRLCAASGCGATIGAGAVPGDAPFAWRVAFGEDYQLLFTAPANQGNAVRSIATMYGIDANVVGRLEAQPGLRLADGAPWPAPLFTHFDVGPSSGPGAPR